MWGYRAKSCGQLLGYLIEDLSESFDASMVDRCSRKWQCSSPENQIACHISIYFSWYSVSQILQMQARPNPSILSVFLEVWVTLWPERILGHSAACSSDFFRRWNPDPPLHQRKRHCLWLCIISWLKCQVYGGIIDTNQERSRPFPGYFNLCCLSYFGWIDFFFMSNSHFFWSMCVTWDPDDTKSSKTGVEPSISGLFI